MDDKVSSLFDDAAVEQTVVDPSYNQLNALNSDTLSMLSLICEDLQQQPWSADADYLSKNEIKKSIECDSGKLIRQQQIKDCKCKEKIIGEGSYGKVYLTLRDSEIVALKVANDDCREFAKHEIEVLKDLGEHENIIELIDYNDDETSTWFTMEYCGQNSSLREMVDENHEKLTLKSIKNIARQLLRAVSFMHRRHYMHCDIKSENVLLVPTKQDPNYMIVKLIDFGSAKRFDDNEIMHEPVLATDYTMAPELMTLDGNFNYTSKIDIWSVGCIMIEMYKGIRKVSFLGAPAYPEGISKDFKDFLDHCFAENPQDRYDAVELLKHPFLNEF